MKTVSFFIFTFLFHISHSGQVDNDPNLERDANDKISNICSQRGIFNNNYKECSCLPGYITLKNSENICSYKLRSKNVALLLSIFSGILGTEHFYLGNNFWGFMKVIIPFISFFIIIYLKIFLRYKYSISDIYLLIPLVLIALFWIMDIILIAIGFTTDGYGNKLL